MIKLQAAQCLAATAEWWAALDEEQKKEYIEEHPDSKYAKEKPKEDDPDEEKIKRLENKMEELRKKK